MKVGTIKVKQKTGRRSKTKEGEAVLAYRGSNQKRSKPEGMKVNQKDCGGRGGQRGDNLCKAGLCAEPSGLGPIKSHPT